MVRVRRSRPIKNLSQLGLKAKHAGRGKLVRMSHAKTQRRKDSGEVTTKDTKSTKKVNSMSGTFFVSIVFFVVRLMPALRLGVFA